MSCATRPTATSIPLGEGSPRGHTLACNVKLHSVAAQAADNQASTMAGALITASCQGLVCAILYNSVLKFYPELAWRLGARPRFAFVTPPRLFPIPLFPRL